MQLENECLQVRLAAYRINLLKQRHRRCEAKLIDFLLIHAGAIVVAHKLLYGSSLPVCAAGNLVQDDLELVFCILPGLPTAAPSVHVPRDWILFVPGSIGIFGEVGAGIGGAIEIAEVNPALLSFLSKGR